MEIQMTHITGKMLLMLGKMAWGKMHIPSRRFKNHIIIILFYMYYLASYSFLIGFPSLWSQSLLFQGCDCLGYIKYFDAHFTNFTGGVETIENCVCLHEEDHGMLWKHQDWRTGLAEVRRSRRLSASFMCTVANYEYGFFWHFYQASQTSHLCNRQICLTLMTS